MCKYLYRVSFDLREDETLTPKLPNSPMEHEDRSIPRVSTSLTIEGCLSGIPRFIERIKLAKKYQDSVLKLYIIKANNLKTIDYMELADKVPDSNITKECWILDKVKEENFDIKYIRIKSFDEQAVTVEGTYREVTLITSLSYEEFPPNDLSILEIKDSDKNSEYYFMLGYNKSSSRSMETLIKGGVTKEELYSGYTDEQLEQLCEGLKRNLDISVYMNPKYHWQVMFMCRKGLSLGIDMVRYMKDDVTDGELSQIIKNNTKIRSF